MGKELVVAPGPFCSALLDALGVPEDMKVVDVHLHFPLGEIATAEFKIQVAIEEDGVADFFTELKKYMLVEIDDDEDYGDPADLSDPEASTI